MASNREISYRDILEKLDLGFCILEKVEGPSATQFDFRIVDTNQAFNLFAGSDNVVGKSFHEVFPSEPRERLLFYDSVRRTGVPVRFERTLVRGETMEAYVFRIENEPPYRIALFFRDISERKTAERALRDHEEFLRNILDCTPDYIAVLDLEGRVEYWNEAAKAEEKGATDRSLGRLWQDIWQDPQERAAAQQAQSEALAGRQGVFEGHVISPEGRTRWWEVLVSAIPDDSARPRKLLALAHEITGRKVAEQGRQRFVEELQRSNIDLTQFPHMVAHDLQAPVRTIGTLLSLLEDRKKGDQEVSKMILSATERMGNLISSLLDYARVGHEKLRITRVSVSDVVKDVEEMLAPFIQETGTQIIYGSLPTLQADPIQLEQLFQNLVSNAIKYRRDGVPPVIKMNAEPVESGWQFSVRDNGQGIIPANQKSVFEPLKRFAKEGVPGSGLGLSVCRTIVERHGGKIWVDSEPDVGSTFSFTLAANTPRSLGEAA